MWRKTAVLVMVAALQIAPSYAQLSPNEIIRHVNGRWAPLIPAKDGKILTYDCSSNEVLEITLEKSNRHVIFRQSTVLPRRAEVQAVSSNKEGSGTGYLILTFEDEAHLKYKALQMFWFLHMQSEAIMSTRRADQLEAARGFYHACPHAGPMIG